MMVEIDNEIIKEGRGRPIGTGRWIVSHLTNVEKDYCFRMWKQFREELERYGYHPPSYASFCKYVYCMRRLGILERCGHTGRPKIRTAFPPVYLKLVPDRVLHSISTKNPQKAVFPDRTPRDLTHPRIRDKDVR